MTKKGKAKKHDKQKRIQITGRQRDHFIGLLQGMIMLDYSYRMQESLPLDEAAKRVNTQIKAYEQKGLNEQEYALIYSRELTDLMESFTPDEKLKVMLGEEGFAEYQKYKEQKLR